jgi:hypothetical protein
VLSIFMRRYFLMDFFLKVMGLWCELVDLEGYFAHLQEYLINIKHQKKFICQKIVKLYERFSKEIIVSQATNALCTA